MIGTREKRFLRYTSIGVSTFLLDLLLLFVLIDALQVQYLIATAGAFLVAASLNYGLSRHFVFKKTTQGFVRGYFYFLKWALMGMAFTALLMWVVTEHTSMSVYMSRIVIAGCVGMMTYLGNLYYNFRVAGTSLD